MKAKSLCAVAVLALALGFAACGEDDDEENAATGTGTGTTTQEEQPAPTGPASATVKLTETEFKIDPADVQVDDEGVVEFDVENAGSVTHALEVEGAGLEEETDDIAPGDSATLKVDLAKGVYKLYCPIDGHEEQGMVGELSVAGATGSPEDEDESSDDDDAPSSGY